MNFDNAKLKIDGFPILWSGRIEHYCFCVFSDNGDSSGASWEISENDCALKAFRKATKGKDPAKTFVAASSHIYYALRNAIEMEIIDLNAKAAYTNDACIGAPPVVLTEVTTAEHKLQLIRDILRSGTNPGEWNV